MRLALLLLALSILRISSAQTIDYERPTTDSDLTAQVSPCSGSGTNMLSASMSAVYSGKSGIGPTGAYGELDATYSGGSHWSGREFSAWESPAFSYSSLTINITVSQSGSGAGTQACYSTNSGSTWASFGNMNVGSTETTFAVSINGAVLSNILVKVLTLANSTGTKSTFVYDLWTAGTEQSTGFPGFIRSSLHEHRKFKILRY